MTKLCLCVHIYFHLTVLDSDLFEKSLEEGSLNITIASIIFTGLEEFDSVNAKHVVFQEPISSKPAPVQSHNNIYFRPQGHLELRKFYHNNLNEAVLYSAIFNSETVPLVVDAAKLDVAIETTSLHKVKKLVLYHPPKIYQQPLHLN